MRGEANGDDREKGNPEHSPQDGEDRAVGHTRGSQNFQHLGGLGMMYLHVVAFGKTNRRQTLDKRGGHK